MEAIMESSNATAHVTTTLVRPPPPGVTPNFSHSSSAVNAIFIAAGICGFVVILLAVMRLYTKICLRPKWAVVDYFTLLSMAWTIGYIPLIASVFNQGQFGHHSWDILVAKLSNKQYLLVLLAEVLYGPVLFIIKMSLLLLYREIWTRNPSWMHQWTAAGIATFGLFYLAMTAAEIALCAPRSGEDYIQALSSPRCQRTKALAICSGVFNIISDTYLLVLPIKPTWQIHGPTNKKLSITIVFMSGIIAWVAGILGLYYRIKLLESKDVLWDLTPLFISIWVYRRRQPVQIAQPAQPDPANNPSSVTQQKTDSVCSDTIRRLIDDYTRSRTFEMLSWETKQDDSQVLPACQSELAAVHFA
ncbi:MAG: hypothetical protein Q9214_003202 [Letrouitia sp. 1 TL-2023]